MKNELNNVKEQLSKLSDVFELIHSSMTEAVDKMEKLDKIEDIAKQKLEIEEARRKLEKLNQKS